MTQLLFQQGQRIQFSKSSIFNVRCRLNLNFSSIQYVKRSTFKNINMKLSGKQNHNKITLEYLDL